MIIENLGLLRGNDGNADIIIAFVKACVKAKVYLKRAAIMTACVYQHNIIVDQLHLGSEYDYVPRRDLPSVMAGHRSQPKEWDIAIIDQIVASATPRKELGHISRRELTACKVYLSTRSPD